MTALSDGDRTVFSEVFTQLQPIVCRFCLAMLRSDADANDAAQEAMTKIFLRAIDYEHGRPVRPWALAIAGFECRTILQRKRRRRESALVAEAAHAHDGEEALIEQQLSETALAALGELSEMDRETLVAAFWDEAASSGATVRKRRERALTRIRKAFWRLYGLD